MKKKLITIAFTLLFIISFTSVKAQYYTNTGYVFSLNGFTGLYTYSFSRQEGGTTYYYYYNNSNNTFVGVSANKITETIITYRSASGPIDGGLSILLIGGAAYHLKRRKGVKENNENDNSRHLTA